MKNFERTVYPFQYMILIGIANIADGLVLVLSLGNYSSSFSLRVALWNAKRSYYTKNQIEKEK